MLLQSAWPLFGAERQSETSLLSLVFGSVLCISRLSRMTGSVWAGGQVRKSGGIGLCGNCIPARMLTRIGTGATSQSQADQGFCYINCGLAQTSALNCGAHLRACAETGTRQKVRNVVYSCTSTRRTWLRARFRSAVSRVPSAQCPVPRASSANRHHDEGSSSCLRVKS